MVFRILMQFLSNNEKLIERLSESYPVRRAAQLVVLVFHRGKGVIEDPNFRQRLTSNEFKLLIQKLAKNMKGQIRDVQEQGKKRN